MASSTDYQTFVDEIAVCVTSLAYALAPIVGESRLLGMVVFGMLMAPVAILFVYLVRTFAPALSRRYFSATVIAPAMVLWRYKAVASGLTQAGAKTSMALGLAAFFAVHALIALSLSWRVRISAWAALFVAVAIVGLLIRGNVPTTVSGYRRYMQLFQEPTVTGLTVGLTTALLQFLIGFGAFLINGL